MAYFLQQSLNALTIGCIYALVALGYTMVHGLVGRFNLAHGETFMVGAFAAFVAASVLAALGVAVVPVGVFVMLGLSLAATAVWGWTVHGIVFDPLGRDPGQAPLIATIGLAIVLQEGVRLLHESGDLWLHHGLGGGAPWQVNDGAPVYIGYRNLLIAGVTAAAFAGHLWFIRHLRWGRHQRACAQDAAMAALLGVDVRRTVATTFAVAAAYAGLGGLIAALHYGVINFYMGFSIGLKALTAAVVGGIGSPVGALLGGLLVAGAETLWSAYCPVSWRDVVVFALLVAVLIFRPAGLVARPAPEGLPGPGAPHR